LNKNAVIFYLKNNLLKKAISIFLFSCFTIYHFGHYAFYFSYSQLLESQWVAQIYGAELQGQPGILIEVPLSMPYMANQEDFQPTNTPIEKDGSYFRVVKQRYQNDTLQLIAVPDTARKALDYTFMKWISFLTTDENPQNENGVTILNLPVKDYLQPDAFNLEFPQILQEINSPKFTFSTYINPFFKLKSPPPKIG
jgi:hypothetical protein